MLSLLSNQIMTIQIRILLLVFTFYSGAFSFRTGFGTHTRSPVSSLCATRRDVLLVTTTTTAAAGMAAAITKAALLPSAAVAAETPSSSPIELLNQLKEAKAQLAAVPALIEKEQWDSVRNILIQPPLSDCWSKNPMTAKFAEAVGNAEGDELAALEIKEDITSHLRYLDMAVYNNVFNPITTEGTTGATKELVCTTIFCLRRCVFLSLYELAHLRCYPIYSAAYFLYRR